ncbi:hypothetical protein NQ314_006032 [Rhamnusium bicolor]|uniref:DUF4371 domain-containing protein n=1 Tax=Rhamnusium bicolor TaxID=1586634 RepID=A0AAV8ZAU2_9CUCU|nr:hypothetical protein NQ314_006032 [Rhamnusium bicolor]
MELPEFKPWLRPVEGKVFKGKCIACDAEFVSELSTIKKHQNSTKHKNIVAVKGKSSSNVLMKFMQSASTSSPHKIDVKTAENKLCGFLAEHNISFLTMDHLCPLLVNIFADSKIAKDLAVRRTKSKAIITNVISHKNDLSAILKTTKFSVLTDESTDTAASKSACIVVKYFNEHFGKVMTSLWEVTSVFDEKGDPQFLESQGTAEHLFSQIMTAFDKYNIPPTNIIGFGSDGCNVMMGEYNSVSSRFKELCPGIFILKCICHSLHLCSSQACKSLPRATEDLARNIYTFFLRYLYYHFCNVIFTTFLLILFYSPVQKATRF